MEGGRPGPEILEQQMLDLLSLYSDLEITIFGVTKPIKDLAEMCPIDLRNDPSVTQEMTNDFVVKAANASGAAIQPEHKDYFDQRLEALGIEPKYTLFEQPAPETVAEKVRPEPKERVLGDIVTRVEVDEVAPIISEHTTAQPAEATDLSTLIVQERLRTLNETETSEPEVAATVLPKTNELPAIEQSILDFEAYITPAAKQAEVISLPSTPAEIVTPRVEVEEDKNETVGKVLPFVRPQTSAHEAPSNPVEEVALPIPEAPQLDIAQLEELLQAPPAELFEDMLTFFETFIEVDPVEAELDRAISNNEVDTVEVVEVSQDADPALKELTRTVYEALLQLPTEEKAPAVEAFRSLIGAVHGLAVLEARGAEQIQIEYVEAQIESLSVAFFESLGIAYTAEDVHLFVEALKNGDLLPTKATVEMTHDLEEEGTYESKLGIARLRWNLQDSRYSLLQSLGTLMLTAMAA